MDYVKQFSNLQRVKHFTRTVFYNVVENQITTGELWPELDPLESLLTVG